MENVPVAAFASNHHPGSRIGKLFSAHALSANDPLAIAGSAARASLSDEYHHAERQEGPMPAYVHRAEAYMRENADRPILISDVAHAAGCSVRALQQTFRQFRGTSPKAALSNIRLDRARDALAHGEDPVVAIARRFGFSNNGRFTAAYVRRFGQMPSATRRTSRS